MKVKIVSPEKLYNVRHKVYAPENPYHLHTMIETMI